MVKTERVKTELSNTAPKSNIQEHYKEKYREPETHTYVETRLL